MSAALDSAVTLPKNRFKAAIGAQNAQIGLWLSLANAYSAEICAGAGFDWLLIDGEHSPNELASTLAQLQSIAAYPSQVIVRPRSGDVHLIKQLLDIGVQTLLVPMVESAEQAAAMVAAMRYPPAGVRGVGSALARSSRWSRIPNYLRIADAEMCLLVQVESARGLANLDAIVSTPGVDGVFIGPADLSASLGHLGNPGHPDVLAAIDDAIHRIRAHGKAAGILSFDEAGAKRYLANGCAFVAVGADVSVLARALESLRGKFLTGRVSE